MAGTDGRDFLAGTPQGNVLSTGLDLPVPLRHTDRLHRIEIGLGVASLLLFCLAAIYALRPGNYVERLISVEDVWSINQLRIEQQNVLIQAWRVEMGDFDAPMTSLALTLDILNSRVATLGDGAMLQIYGRNLAFAGARDQVQGALKRVDVIMTDADRLPNFLVAGRVRGEVEALFDPVAIMREIVLRARGEEQAQIEQLLVDRRQRLTVIASAGGVAFAAFLLIYLFQRHELRAAEQRFRETFDRAGVGIALISRSGRVIRANKLLHRAADGPLLRVEQILRDARPWAAIAAPLLAGGQKTLTLEHEHAGTQREIDISPARRADGTIETFVLVARDVTQQRSIQAQLHKAQKMEAVGQLTGGIAHDFNNLLGVIVGNLDLLRRAMGGEARAVRNVDRALAAAERGASLTRRLLSFARKEILRPTPVALRQFVDDLTTLLRPAMGSELEIATDIPADLPAVVADAGQLEAALFNLSINARDAMSPGGRLTIAARAITLDDDDGQRELAAGRYAVIEVRDTGAGIPAAVLERVFEPFFTTKGEGKGSGLGLAMVYGFAKQSGGHAEVETEVGTGTTVRLYLPLAATEDV
jgi:signal transduction histidine kinase